MTDPTQQQETEKALSSRFPTAYTILFLLIIFVAALTWIIPAGKYDRVMSDEVGREIAVPGTYQVVEAKPQGFVDVMLAPTAGFYNPDSYVANAIDVALFVLFLGGFLGVMNATGAIDTGIRSAMRRLQGRELWMIPILMTLFAFGGTTYGMAEETLAFYAILIPVIISAGYDAVTGVAIVMIGAGIVIGFIGRLGEKKLTESFVDGARDLLGVALVVGLARGIVMIMEQGMIADTILNSAETTLGGLPELAFINLMFWIEVGMSFFVPSSSGLAVLSMPILAPLADFAHVDRALVVTAFQSANGLVNLINPTFAVVLGGLAIGRVSYDRWLVFVWPLLLILTLFITAVLSFGALL